MIARRSDMPSSTITDISGLDETSETYAAMRGLHHNHTYLNGFKTDDDSETFHPYSYKNKMKKILKNIKNDGENISRQQESRDQILLQENNIDLSLSEIVDTNPDDFNQLLKGINLTTEQLSIVKDIRRRGKNKVAAQICRKRKIDSIDSLKEDIGQLKEVKSKLKAEQEMIGNEVMNKKIFNKIKFFIKI